MERRYVHSSHGNNVHLNDKFLAEYEVSVGISKLDYMASIKLRLSLTFMMVLLGFSMLRAAKREQDGLRHRFFY